MKVNHLFRHIKQVKSVAIEELPELFSSGWIGIGVETKNGQTFFLMGDVSNQVEDIDLSNLSN